MTSQTINFTPDKIEVIEYELWRMSHRTLNIEIPSCNYINDFTSKSVWSIINKHTCWPTMRFENSVLDSIKTKVKSYKF